MEWNNFEEQRFLRPPRLLFAPLPYPYSPEIWILSIPTQVIKPTSWPPPLPLTRAEFQKTNGAQNGYEEVANTNASQVKYWYVQSTLSAWFRAYSGTLIVSNALERYHCTEEAGQLKARKKAGRWGCLLILHSRWSPLAAPRSAQKRGLDRVYSTWPIPAGPAIFLKPNRYFPGGEAVALGCGK